MRGNQWEINSFAEWQQTDWEGVSQPTVWCLLVFTKWLLVTLENTISPKMTTGDILGTATSHVQHPFTPKSEQIWRMLVSNNSHPLATIWSGHIVFPPFLALVKCFPVILISVMSEKQALARQYWILSTIFSSSKRRQNKTLVWFYTVSCLYYNDTTTTTMQKQLIIQINSLKWPYTYKGGAWLWRCCPNFIAVCVQM